MREMLRMILVLSVICAVAGTVLAGLKATTRERIQTQELVYVQGPAIERALPAHDNDPIAERRRIEVAGREEPLTVFPAYRDGQLVGLAFEAVGAGYGGDIGVMVGFDAAGDTITGIGVTTMKETPGVGTRVAEAVFRQQFAGHPLENLATRAAGGDIDAVAGATYSTKGVLEAVRTAVELRRKLDDGLREDLAAAKG
jgi:electron transport complex protein RnfG